jgi:hypothetical protein
MTKTAYVYKKVDSYNQTTGENTFTWELFETIDNVAYYEGASAERLISDRFKAEVDGVIIINPDNIINTIEDEYKIIIDDINYSVIHCDNILQLDEVLTVAVKRMKNV